MFAFILVLLAAWGASPAFAADPTPSYLAELQQSAKVRQLATSPVWLNLLHYKRHPLTGQVRSLADDPAFFAAADGARNAQAELDATLARFFEDISETPTTQSAQCRYRARFVWLSAQLGFDERLPRAPCPRFDTWRAAMNPQGLTLIYASAYLNSPASMYGHTMFRVDQAGQRPSTETLAYTLSYAADGDSNDGLGIGFAFKGLMGLYPGLFSSTPYYLRVREYSDLENRDIWEYQLALSAPEIDMVLAHAWELGSVRFDYFFFDENCSYHILSLLDVARPSLQLTDQFVWNTIPIDTVKAAMALPGLVKQVRYRPSQLSLLQARADTLKPLQLQWAKELSLGTQSLAKLNEQPPSPLDAAQVLEFSDLYLAYQQVAGGVAQKTADEHLHALRLARSSLPTVAAATPPTPATRPDQGHGSARLALAYGQHNQQPFVEVGLRPALHDLLDPEAGYARGAQIAFGEVSARLYEHEHAEVERVDFIHIASLSPRTALFQPKSWRVRWGLERLESTVGRVAAHALAGSMGMAWDLAPHVIAYGFAEVRTDYVPEWNTRTSMGAGASLGALWDVNARWRVMVNLSFMENSHASLGVQRSTAIASRWTLHPDYALVLQGQHTETNRSSDSVTLQLRRYF